MSTSIDHSRRERNKVRTKNDLLAAARQLFAAKGVNGTTVEELAELAEVSRATFFNYFPSKHALLHELWGEMLIDVADDIEQELARDASTSDRIRGVFRRSARTIEREPEFFRAVTGALDVDWGTNTISKFRVDEFHRILHRLIAAGLALGDVRTDLDAGFLTEMVAAVYVAIQRKWRLTPNLPLAAEFDRGARFLRIALSPPASAIRPRRTTEKAKNDRAAP